jgi:hypothetical protein
MQRGGDRHREVEPDPCPDYGERDEERSNRHSHRVLSRQIRGVGHSELLRDRRRITELTSKAVPARSALTDSRET